jgi:hypothetical protein
VPCLKHLEHFRVLRLNAIGLEIQHLKSRVFKTTLVEVWKVLEGRELR